MDKITPERRSRNMSRIKSKNTKPEILLRRALYARGVRYRLHCNMRGRPDIAFKGHKIVIFVNGCFWHGCSEHYVAPKSNQSFWENKLRSNIRRDEKTDEFYQKGGWRVFRFWEHELKKSQQADSAAERIAMLLKS